MISATKQLPLSDQYGFSYLTETEYSDLIERWNSNRSPGKRRKAIEYCRNHGHQYAHAPIDTDPASNMLVCRNCLNYWRKEKSR